MLHLSVFQRSHTIVTGEFRLIKLFWGRYAGSHLAFNDIVTYRSVLVFLESYLNAHSGIIKVQELLSDLFFNLQSPYDVVELRVFQGELQFLDPHFRPVEGE